MNSLTVFKFKMASHPPKSVDFVFTYQENLCFLKIMKLENLVTITKLAGKATSMRCQQAFFHFSGCLRSFQR